LDLERLQSRRQMFQLELGISASGLASGKQRQVRLEAWPAAARMYPMDDSVDTVHRVPGGRDPYRGADYRAVVFVRHGRKKNGQGSGVADWGNDYLLGQTTPWSPARTEPIPL